MYEADHPNAQIGLYRQIGFPSVSGSSIPISPVKTGFKHHKNAWKYLDSLEEETQSDITSLILLTPDETKKSFANFEFRRPCPVGPLKNKLHTRYNECRS